MLANNIFFKVFANVGKTMDTHTFMGCVDELTSKALKVEEVVNGYLFLFNDGSTLKFTHLGNSFKVIIKASL